MALPQPAIEQLSRKVPRGPAWFGELLMFAGTVFFIAAAIYLGLRFGYKPYLEGQVRKLDDRISVFSQEIPEAEQQKIVAFYSQLSNLRTLLGKHTFLSPVLTALEQNTLPGVYFSKFALTLSNSQLALTGVARELNDVAIQVRRFETVPVVRRVDLKSLSNTGSRVQFEVALALDPALFKSAPGQAPAPTPPPTPTP